MNGKLPIIIILLILLISPVLADAGTPPYSIYSCSYVTYAQEVGIWWSNPEDTDFAGVQMWVDNVYVGTTSDSSTRFYTTHIDATGWHTFSTHTIDTFANVNPVWVNQSFEILPGLYSCSEGHNPWSACSEIDCVANVTPTPTYFPTTTVTITPTSWVGVTYAPSTDICSIQADMGETWVKWDATCNTSVEVMYYIDGKKLENVPPYVKLDPNRLILSDLQSIEKHNLKIYYLGNVVAESTVQTLPEWYMILFFVVLSVVLSIIALLFVVSPISRILLGAVSLVISVWLLTIVTGWMIAVPTAPAIFAGIVIILALRDQIEQSWGSN